MSVENRELPRRLSEELTALRESISEHGVTLGEMMDRLQGRAFMLFLILLSVPFCQPIPLPGLSVIFGLVVAFIGLRIALRMPPWLPERLRKIVVTGKIMDRLIGAATWLLKWIEKWSRPRSVEHLESSWTHSIYGVIIFSAGLLLILPPPFANFFPGITVLICAVAVMENDDKIGLLGMGLFAINLTVFGAIFFGGASLLHWLGNLFH